MFATRVKNLDPSVPLDWKTLKTTLKPRQESDGIPTRAQANAIKSRYVHVSRRQGVAPSTVKVGKDAVFRAVTLHELETAIGQSPCRKACGCDGVAAELVHHLGPRAKAALLWLLNVSLRRGIVPHMFRVGIWIPILKPGKPPGVPSSYRPVMLTSSLSKVMERVINVRLLHVIDLSALQHGFRKCRSTCTALVTIVDAIIRSWNQTHMVDANRSDQPGKTMQRPQSDRAAALLLDLETAFDTVDHDVLIRGLTKLGVDPFLVRWVRNWMFGRTAHVRMSMGVTSKQGRIGSGVPQGSVLGPMLFVIHMNSLLEKLETVPGIVTSPAYADDQTCVAVGANAEAALAPLSECAARALAWCSECHMKVAASKSYCILHRVSTHTASDTAPGLGVVIGPEFITPLKTDLESRLKMKELGVIMDEKLTFMAHVRKIIPSVRQRLMQLKHVAGGQTGPKRDTLLTFYKGYVLPVLLYGCEVWYPRLPKTGMMTLEKLHRQGLRTVAGLHASTPTTDVYLESGCPSLETLAKIRLVNFYERTRRTNTICRLAIDPLPVDPVTVGLRKDTPFVEHPRQTYDDLVARICPALGLAVDHPRVPLYERPMVSPSLTDLVRTVVFPEAPGRKPMEESEVEIKARKVAHNRAVMDSLPEGDFHALWTDGSAPSKVTPMAPSGSAAILELRRGRRILQTLLRMTRAAGLIACSYTAEMRALAGSLEEACAYFETATEVPLKFLHVLSDSLSSLQVLSSGPLAQYGEDERRVWEALLILSGRGVKVSFHFIYSHVGFNEEVDALADVANRLPRQAEVPIRYEDFKNASGALLIEEWRLGLAETDRTRTLGKEFTTHTHGPMGRPMQTLWSQLRVGCCASFGEYAWRIGLRENNDCRWCHPPPPRPPPPPPPPAVKGKGAVQPNHCLHCTLFFQTKDLLKQHVSLHHPLAISPLAFPCDPPCTRTFLTADSRRVHRQWCSVWREAHDGDPAPPEHPPDTGRPQETLEHLLYSCQCPEIALLRTQYAKIFSAPTVNAWLASPHIAHYVHVAHQMLVVRVRAATTAAAAARAQPRPKAAGPVPGGSTPNILSQKVQSTLRFVNKDKDSRGKDT